MRSDIKATRERYRRAGAKAVMRALGAYAGAAALGALAVVLSVAAWRMYGRMALASEGETAAKAELAQVKAQQTQVSGDLQDLSTPTGVEGALRRRYGVAKPGEGVIRIVEASAASSTVAAQPPPEGLWSRIWRAFFP